MGWHIRDLCWVAGTNFQGYSVDHTYNNRENSLNCLSQAYVKLFNGITAYCRNYLSYGFFRRDVNNWLPAFFTSWRAHEQSEFALNFGYFNKSLVCRTAFGEGWGKITWDKILRFATNDKEMFFQCLKKYLVNFCLISTNTNGWEARVP